MLFRRRVPTDRRLKAGALLSEEVYQTACEDRTGRIALVCEHASNRMPSEAGGLGLTAADLESHIAWDPGALALSHALMDRLAAPLISATYSRLLYDLNRDPSSTEAIRAVSEATEIPGNRGLSGNARQTRVNTFYLPWRAALASFLQRVRPLAMVTVHSFTPVYLGKPRAVEIGVLHGADARLAEALLSTLPTTPFKVERNAPYGPQDEVMHTLDAFAHPRGLPSLMLEIRNDLLRSPEEVARMADHLAPALIAALDLVRHPAGGADVVSA